MNIRKLLNKCRRLFAASDHRSLLAVLFLGALFYLASDTLPTAFTHAAGLALNGPRRFTALRDQLNYDYQHMLTYQENILLNKGSYINFNGLMARLMNQRTMNEIIKLDNGHLAELSKPQDITAPAARITALCREQQKAGGAFLFVLAPYQIPGDGSLLPSGFEDYGNQNADLLLERLSENNVPWLDLRREMASESLDYTDAFFITDHHWRTETGFWAYTRIVNHLAGQGLLNVADSRLTDSEAFHSEVLEDWFLGSYGRRTGSYYAGVDDFAIISPRFTTDIRLEIPALGVHRQGAFEDVIYNLATNRKDYFNNLLYDTYTYGGYHRKYSNPNAPNKLKLLTIGDSYAWSAGIYLPLVVSSYEEIDMRRFTENFTDYFHSYQPDVMIVLANAADAAEGLNTNYDFF